MFKSLIVSALLATATFAMPAAKRQEPGPWCNGLGGGAFDVASGFTLAAYNTTTPNANTTGAPLVFGQAGAVDGAEFEVLSTYASFPYDDFPTLSLSEGKLLPQGAESFSADSSVTAGQALSWVITSLDTPAPAQIYCAVASTSAHGGGTGFPQLAVNGDTNSFSLCVTGDYPLAQWNVIYKANDAQFSGYDFSSCYPVVLQLIGLD